MLTVPCFFLLNCFMHGLAGVSVGQKKAAIFIRLTYFLPYTLSTLRKLYIPVLSTYSTVPTLNSQKAIFKAWPGAGSVAISRLRLQLGPKGPAPAAPASQPYLIPIFTIGSGWSRLSSGIRQAWWLSRLIFTL